MRRAILLIGASARLLYTLAMPLLFVLAVIVFLEITPIGRVIQFAFTPNAGLLN